MRTPSKYDVQRGFETNFIVSLRFTDISAVILVVPLNFGAGRGHSKSGGFRSDQYNLHHLGFSGLSSPQVVFI